MLVTTTTTIAERCITETLGQVFGLAVRTRGVAGNIMAGLASLDALSDDSMSEFLAGLTAARDEAISRMVARAAELGADAVVRMRFDTSPVGHDMTEIVVYGTAVKTQSRTVVT